MSRPGLARVVFLNWVPTCRKVKRDEWNMKKCQVSTRQKDFLLDPFDIFEQMHLLNEAR